MGASLDVDEQVSERDVGAVVGWRVFMPMTLASSLVLAVAFGLGVLEWIDSPKYAPSTLATDIAASPAWRVCSPGAAVGPRTGSPSSWRLISFTWLLGALSAGVSKFDVYRAPLVHLLLSYPTGRLDGRLSRPAWFWRPTWSGEPFGQLQPVPSIAPLPSVIVALAAIGTARFSCSPRARGRAMAAAGAVAVAAVSIVLTLVTLAGWLEPDTESWASRVVLGATGIFLAADLRWGGWPPRRRCARRDPARRQRWLRRTLRGRIADASGHLLSLLGMPPGGPGEYVDETGRRLDVAEPAPFPR